MDKTYQDTAAHNKKLGLIGSISNPQPIRCIHRKLAVDQIWPMIRQFVSHGGPRVATPHDASQSGFSHQPVNLVTTDLPDGTSHREPHFAHPNTQYLASWPS